jgi:excinuclease ABC subunit C
VGEKRRAALLKRFGSVRAIREAELEALQEALPANVARRVYDYYHGEDGENVASNQRDGERP